MLRTKIVGSVRRHRAEATTSKWRQSNEQRRFRGYSGQEKEGSCLDEIKQKINARAAEVVLKPGLEETAGSVSDSRERLRLILF
jgi:hypothetical protein